MTKYTSLVTSLFTADHYSYWSADSSILERDCHVIVEVGEFTKMVAGDGIKYRPISVSRHA